MQITIEVKETNELFLKETFGEGTIGDEPLNVGVSLPDGNPYVYLRGKYYLAQKVFETMIVAVHEAEGCEPPVEGVA